jgi:excinuclease ABC subunit A
MPETIAARGIRVHNLKGIDVALPAGRLVAVTGVSGAGKSSLAFDTFFAEGQRRYIESLSAHTRHLLEKLDRPAVDSFEGVCPSIGLRRRAPPRSPRATVATAGDVHELLRNLFAERGVTECLRCGGAVGKDSPQSAAQALLELPAGTPVMVAFPGAGTSTAAELEKLAARGYRRVLDDGPAVPLEEATPRPGLLVVVDRIRTAEDARTRLCEALETALREGAGEAWVSIGDGERRRFTEAFVCRGCGEPAEEPRPRLFSFNDPSGACPACHGFGSVVELDPDRIVSDPGRSLGQGAIEPWRRPRHRGLRARLRRFCQEQRIPWRTPWRRLRPEHQRLVMQGHGEFPGVAGFFRHLERRRYRVQVRVFLSRYRRYRPCPACAGRRLRPEALAVRVAGKGIDEVCRLSIEEARAFVDALEGEAAASLRARLSERLRLLAAVGLGYLTLERPLGSLSGGEAQRVALAGALGSGLTGSLYVLDEPSAGLHPLDVERLAATLAELRDRGNTVVLVEHEPILIRAADHVVDLGPGAGEQGGRLVFSGPPAELEQDGRSLTGKYLRGELRVPGPERRRKAGPNWLRVRGARRHNLQGIDVRFPLGALTCVTGVSGSGKSTLVFDVLAAMLERRSGRGDAAAGLDGAEAIRRVVALDHAPIGRTPRSNPVTYLKALDPIRALFAGTPAARRLGLSAADFSFNVAGGRCEVCGGAGVVVMDMHFLADATLPCDGCGGRRFRPPVLEARYRGRTIHEVLQMTAQEALHFFTGQPKVVRRLRPFLEVGLGYLRLGQPANTLSAGESQRLKLAAELGRPAARSLYLLDEPTTGLHAADVSELVAALWRLLEEGATVIVVEHHMDVVKQADWVLELGPAAGARGGRLLYEGPPEGLARAEHPSSRHLRAALGDTTHGADLIRPA